MSDIFIRREDARPRIGPWLAWGGAAVLLALIIIGVRQFARSARPRETTGDAPTSAAAAAAPPKTDTPAATVPVAAVAPEKTATDGPALALLAEGKALRAAGRLNDAREKLYEALAAATSEAARNAVEAVLGDLNLELVTSPHPMAEKVDYIIRPGDKLAVIARRHGTTVELLRKSNNIRGDLIRPNDRLRVLQGTFSIHISKSRNDLELRLNDRFFKRYRVGTGKYDRTPTGQFKIVDRIVEPPWWRPDGTPLPYGHPENVLGTRWLALDIKGYGIHGTWEPDTIGRAESAGCIRLLNSDVEELFDLVPVGTAVTIED